MAVQDFGDLNGAVRRAPEAEEKRSHSTQQEPGLEGAKDGPLKVVLLKHPCVKGACVATEYDRTGQDVRMTVEILCCGMNNDVGQDRRARSTPASGQRYQRRPWLRSHGNTNGGRQNDEFERGIGEVSGYTILVFPGRNAGALAECDVVEIATIAKPSEMAHLIDHPASSASQLLYMSKPGSQLHVNCKTVASGSLCANTCSWSVKFAPGSQRAEAVRQGAEAGVSGFRLLAAAQRMSPADVAGDQQKLGPLPECSVCADLAKAVAMSDETTAIGHYRSAISPGSR